MVIGTFVVDIRPFKKSIFRQNVVFVDQNVANILTKNGFLMAHMSASSVVMAIPL